MQEGDFVFSVKVKGRQITRIPFSIFAQKSDDPFNPQTRYAREGPWSRLGYMTADPEQPEEALQFHWWSCVRELPDGEGGKVVVKVLKDGEVIADSKGFFVSKKIWQSCAKPLRVSGSGGRRFFTMTELCSQDGTYQVALDSGGKTIRTYELAVKGGRLQHHPRSALGYEPRADHITPKVIAGSAGNSSGFKMIEAYWMDAQ